MRQAISISLLVCLLWSQASASLAGSIQPFGIDTYQRILAERKGKAFMLVFWSIDCPPCHQELAMLGKQAQQKLQSDLVLVSTDTGLEQTELLSVLARYRLQHLHSYVFDDNPAQSLRYTIDPAWYGELPRSYLFTRQHTRQAISGLLSEEELLNWLKPDI